VGGDLRIGGPGVALRLTGDGDTARLSVAGRLPRGWRAAAAVGARLAAAGMVVEVTDPAGRVLARTGAVRPSLVGRLLAGTPAIRPTRRGLLTALRGRTSIPPA
jgi:hypothetical protein